MNLPEMLYTIDIILAAFVLFFAVVGLVRGIAGELASLLTLFALLFGVCFYYPILTQLAATAWGSLSPGAIQGVVLLVFGLGTVVLFCLLRILFKQAFKENVGMLTDRIAGMVVGLLRGWLIGLSLMTALSLLPNEALYVKLSEQSVIGGWVCTRFTPWVYPRLMELPVFDQEEN